MRGSPPSLTSLCCPWEGGGYLGGDPNTQQTSPEAQAETQPRSPGPPPDSLHPSPSTREKDLSLKIIVTTEQQTIQRGHYVLRERPRCWRYGERQQRSVLSRLGAAHVLHPRPSHPEACPHPNAHSDSPQGTHQATCLGMCPAPIPHLPTHLHPPSTCSIASLPAPPISRYSNQDHGRPHMGSPAGVGVGGGGEPRSHTV